jgi:hypothetical protein
MVVMSERLVDKYLEAAANDMVRNNRTDVPCPCRKCKLLCVADPYDSRFKVHLLRCGFMDGYTRWLLDEDDLDGGEDEEPPTHDGEDHHEEPDPAHDGEDEESSAHDHGDEDAEQHGEDHADTQSAPLTSVVRDPHVKELLSKIKKNTYAKLAQLETDSNTPLYAGCQSEETCLKVTLGVLQMKSKYKWSDASVDACLEFWKNLLPKGNTCPATVDEAKKIVCPLDLPHDKYHACVNDCIIYRNEDALRIICPVCKAARFKKGSKKNPRKVVWYFPLVPRLQRYFADPKEAKLMRWHAERKEAVLNDRQRTEVLLTHPSDATQWKALDRFDRNFGRDARNIRLGVSTDGLNPYSNQSSTHSTWPVFTWIYNLRPWLCMKRKYIHISMLIQVRSNQGTTSICIWSY